MNKKLIALAVGGVVSAPVAYADITAYGRINNAIDFSDGDTDISTVSSRFGFKGSGDIGNGLTAFGRYEFSTGTDRELPAVGDIRLAFVGLSGGFGSVSIGNQWSAFFNSVGTIVSPTFSLGAGSATPFRASNTIKYANSFGPVSLEVDLRLNDSDEDSDVAEGLNGNGYGIGLTINPTDFFTLALAIDSEEENSSTRTIPADDNVMLDDDDDVVTTGLVTTTTTVDGVTNVATRSIPTRTVTTANDDTDRIGIAATFSFGGFGINVGYQNQEQGDEEIDTTNLYLSYEIGKSKILVGFGNIDDGGGEDNEGNFIGLYHNLGGGLRLWLESVDSDGLDDRITVLGARIDF
jgi:predicted porin